MAKNYRPYGSKRIWEYYEIKYVRGIMQLRRHEQSPRISQIVKLFQEELKNMNKQVIWLN